VKAVVVDSGAASQCGPTHRLLSCLLVFALAAVVLGGGFIAALGYHHRSPWPWNRGWYMFSWDTPVLSRLVATGITESGREVPVELDRWFAYRAAFAARRCDEIRRTPAALAALAAYACRMANRAAAPGDRLLSVTLLDASWHRERGRRLGWGEAPVSQHPLGTYGCAP
jgi:hypothetical protein